MGLLFGAHGVRAALGAVPQARLLDHAAAVFDDADLALDLVLHRGADVAEAVHILNFGLGAELFGIFEHHADVGVAAQRTFLHVAVRNARVEQDFFQLGEVLEHFVSGAQVGLGDDFYQRCAAAVEIDVGACGGVGEAIVETLAGVFFHVQARDADPLVVAIRVGDDEEAVLGDGLVELRNLVALGTVRIEVILARKDAGLANLAVDSLRGKHGELYCLLVEHGQRARQAEAGGAGVRVRLAAVLVAATAESLGPRKQLNVDLEANDGLILGEDFGRESGYGWHTFMITIQSCLLKIARGTRT